MYVVSRWSIADLNGLVGLVSNGNRFANGGQTIGNGGVVSDLDLARAWQRGAPRSARDSHFLRRVDAQRDQPNESIREALLRLDGGNSVRTLRDDGDFVGWNQSPEPRRGPGPLDHGGAGRTPRLHNLMVAR